MGKYLFTETQTLQLVVFLKGSKYTFNTAVRILFGDTINIDDMRDCDRHEFNTRIERCNVCHRWTEPIKDQTVELDRRWGGVCLRRLRRVN